MDEDLYESTEVFTLDTYENMGQTMYRLTSSTGMVRSVLNETDFKLQYRLVTN